MRFAAIVLSAVFLTAVGCATETNITRTVKHANGSTEIYENKSKGYNYNPNFTGTAEQSVHVRDYGYGFGYNNMMNAPVFPASPVIVPGSVPPPGCW